MPSMTMLMDEVIFVPVAGMMLADALQQLAIVCRVANQQTMSVALDDAWAHLLVADFGIAAPRMPESVAAMQSGHEHGTGASRAAHRALSELRRRFSRTVIVIPGDICDVPRKHFVEAIVCPSVPNCGPYGPCARAVHYIAGPELWKHLQTQLLPAIGGSLDVGQAIMAPPFDFENIRAIVHVVGPTLETPNRKARLQEAYSSAFRLLRDATHESFSHAAIASISTGGNGISPREAAPIAMAAIRDAVRLGGLEQLYFVAWDEYTRSVFEDAKQEVLRSLSDDPAIPEVDLGDLGWE